MFKKTAKRLLRLGMDKQGGKEQKVRAGRRRGLRERQFSAIIGTTREILEGSVVGVIHKRIRLPVVKKRNCHRLISKTNSGLDEAYRGRKNCS